MGIKVATGNVRITLEFEDCEVVHSFSRDFVKATALIRKAFAEGSLDVYGQAALWRELVVSVDGYDVEDGCDWKDAVADSRPGDVVSALKAYIDETKKAMALPVPFELSKRGSNPKPSAAPDAVKSSNK